MHSNDTKFYGTVFTHGSQATGERSSHLHDDAPSLGGASIGERRGKDQPELEEERSQQLVHVRGDGETLGRVLHQYLDLGGAGGGGEG